MSDEARSHLFHAFRKVLRPLVKILIRAGVRHDEFAEVIKGVYVESAIRDGIAEEREACAKVADHCGAVTAAAILAEQGIEPVLQFTCRDRNRIALQSDILSAGALRVPNLMMLGGDPPSAGDDPDAKPVFDLDSVGLLRVAKGMRDDKRLMSGREVPNGPRWLLGAAENPYTPLSAGPYDRFAAEHIAGFHHHRGVAGIAEVLGTGQTGQTSTGNGDAHGKPRISTQP